MYVNCVPCIHMLINVRELCAIVQLSQSLQVDPCSGFFLCDEEIDVSIRNLQWLKCCGMLHDVAHWTLEVIFNCFL